MKYVHKNIVNNYEHNKEKHNQRSWFIFILGICCQIVAFLLMNILSSLITPNFIEVLLLNIILILFSAICWISITLLVFISNKKKHTLDKNEKKAFLETYAQNKFEICKYNYNICCLSKASNTSNIEFTFSKKEREENRLYTAIEISEIEKYTNNNWCDIWIFSENLATEVDSLGNIEAVPLLNINSGVNYVEFYLNNNNNETETIQGRINGMMKSIKNSAKKHLQFFPLNTEKGYIGRNTLPLLCGSILFSSRKETNGNLPYFSEGYLSMRKTLDDKPIYYKMPSCMLSEYSNYFKEIYKQKLGGTI